MRITYLERRIAILSIKHRPEIEWLFALPYQEDAKDYFYYNVIHVKDRFLVTTDGFWMCILYDAKIDEEPDPNGDYKRLKNGTLKPIQSDELWYFPPVWKRAATYMDYKGEIFDCKQHLIQYLYSHGYTVPFHLLYHLWEGGYTVTESKGLLMLRSSMGLTVFPV